MNHFLKTKAALFLSMLIIGISAPAKAQQKPAEKQQGVAAKIFEGRKQYRSWTVGANIGFLAPVVLTGSSKYNHYTDWDMYLGYGLTVRKQLGHSFGLEASGLWGKISGNNKSANNGVQNNLKFFSSNINWSANIMGVVNVATIDFLRRENNLNFIVKAGFGGLGYHNAYTTNTNEVVTSDRTEKQFPVGVGAKFKLSDRLNFDLGYTMFFLSSPLLDGGNPASVTPNDFKPTPNGKYSYTYAGIEYSIGSKAKPNLEWVNPLSMMYDELRDPSVQKQLDSLKKIISGQDAKINALSSDSDADGVPDKFDKCTNTPPGSRVDGSGCPLDRCPPVDCFPTRGMRNEQQGYSENDGDESESEGENGGLKKGKKRIKGGVAPDSKGRIHFEFDSSVLRTSAYPTLDKLKKAIQAGTYTELHLDGFASIEGAPEHNMQLSKDRAHSVKTYLVNDGIPDSKIHVQGFGAEKPIASNDTEEGRMLNRRVEIRELLDK